MKQQRILIPLGTLLLCFAACKPDKPIPPAHPPIPIDGRHKFVGVYDVYDTMSNWLYELRIDLGANDSLIIDDWNDDFNMKIRRENTDMTNILGFGNYFGAVDNNGKRWALYRDYDSIFGTNIILNDTLFMSYLKDNIAFYVADGVPYFRQSYREFAVKRDWE